MEFLSAKKLTNVRTEDVEHLAKGKKLGEGTFAVVYLGHFHKRPVVLKVFKSPSALQEMHREGKTLRRLAQVPGVPRAYFTCKAPVTLGMSFDGPSTLSRALRKALLARGQVLDVLLQVARTLQGIHECGVSHNDLQPKNVVLRIEGDRCTATTIDLGNATSFGKIPYPGLERDRFPHIAPELCQGHKPSSKSDVFSLGRLMACVVARVPELKADLEGLSEAALQEDPEDRLSIQVLVEGLQKALSELKYVDQERSFSGEADEHVAKASHSKTSPPPPQKRKRSKSSQDASSSSDRNNKRQKSSSPQQDEVATH
ncbi:megakaryocyte-associated tyrosine-protein kinase-like [Oratosquilla oratoria]|uniref:megakaryocyte-associated tyrosine-protein kinase-like n=1 Tax=Oratosquilla oratoria TaxID=337810 RepID=UPI003F772FEC